MSSYPIIKKEIGDISSEEFKENFKKANKELTKNNIDANSSQIREIPTILNLMDDALELLNDNLYRLLGRLETIYSVLPEVEDLSNFPSETALGSKMSEQVTIVRFISNRLNVLIDRIEL